MGDQEHLYSYVDSMLSLVCNRERFYGSAWFQESDPWTGLIAVGFQAGFLDQKCVTQETHADGRPWLFRLVDDFSIPVLREL